MKLLLVALSLVCLPLAARGDDAQGDEHDAAKSVEQLKIQPDLEVKLFASEPMMTNPASIDVDHLGRVWVCEAINYRAFANADVIGDRQVGDRILVLADADGDAQADSSTVFYQGHDVDSAHGILVLARGDGKETRALVSALDSAFFLIDDDGDLKADRKEVLFTGIGGVQHDHGVHAFHFGPDGKLSLRGSDFPPGSELGLSAAVDVTGRAQLEVKPAALKAGTPAAGDAFDRTKGSPTVIPGKPVALPPADPGLVQELEAVRRAPGNRV